MALHDASHGCFMKSVYQLSVDVDQCIRSAVEASEQKDSLIECLINTVYPNKKLHRLSTIAIYASKTLTLIQSLNLLFSTGVLPHSQKRSVPFAVVVPFQSD